MPGIAFLSQLANFETLKKALYILFLGFYALFCTGLQDLTKLPVLFEHYFEHKSLDSNITFINYLEHHYNDIPHTDNDEDRDSQLPFKTHELFAASLISPALPPSFEIIPKKAYQILPAQKILINNDHIPNPAFAGKIWQPPKTILS